MLKNWNTLLPTKKELVSIAEKQIQACMTTGKVKFMELHACYLEAPIVIASFFVPSKCVAFAKYSMSVVKRKKPLLFTGRQGLGGCDLSSSTDGNFFYLASRRQGHDHVAAEARLVAMIDEFGLLEDEFHSDWVELTKKITSNPKCAARRLSADVFRKAQALL